MKIGPTTIKRFATVGETVDWLLKRRPEVTSVDVTRQPSLMQRDQFTVLVYSAPKYHGMVTFCKGHNQSKNDMDLWCHTGGGRYGRRDLYTYEVVHDNNEKV